MGQVTDLERCLQTILSDSVWKGKDSRIKNQVIHMTASENLNITRGTIIRVSFHLLYRFLEFFSEIFHRLQRPQV